MKNIILLCGSVAKSIENLLSSLYTIQKIEDLSLFSKEMQEVQTYQLVIADKEIILKSQFSENNLPLLAIDQKIEYEDKLKLYSKYVKGTLELFQGDIILLDTIEHNIKYANPYINTFRNHFIKAFVKYEKIDTTISSILYLCNYLIYHYKIEAKLAADLKLVVIFLMIGYEKGNILQMKHLIENMKISHKVEELFQNYENPSSLEEAIVFCSMSVNFKKVNAEEMFLKMQDGKLQDVFQTAHQALINNTIIIDKSYDVDVFWERVSEILFSDKELHYQENAYNINNLYKMILRLFALYGMLEIKMLHTRNVGYEITISMLQKESLDSKECIDFFKPLCEKIDVSECYRLNNNIFHIDFNYNEAKEVLVLEEAMQATLSVKPTIEKEAINTLHFEENQKLSAVQFVEEYGVDYDLLADMDESSADTIEEILSAESLNSDVLEKISTTFDFYARLLNTTLEFEELSYALSTLSRLMLAIELSKINAVQIETLKQYIVGILEDLNDWKSHIYIECDTKDIHYLDASLLENASQIEYFTNPEMEEEEDDDDDDLEFF